MTPLSKRSSYKGVAEISVYIDTDHLGQGIGSKLMKPVIDESEKNGIWTLYASIFPENVGSCIAHWLLLRENLEQIGI